MSTPIQPVPDLVLAPEFPSLADRPAGLWNQKAKDWADGENGMATRTREIAATAHNNAVTATEQAVIATTKASEAAGSAQAAAESEAAAQGYAENLASLDALWLGAATSDPTTGKGGVPLVAGNAYVNSITGYVRAYNGTAWVQGVSAVAGVSSLNGQVGPLALKAVQGQALLGDGDIQVPGIISDFQEFTSSGTWTKPEGATWVYVEAIGGGGGGASSAHDGATVYGGGGGGGEFCSGIFLAEDLPASISVVVGAGGNRSSTTFQATASDGGVSSFGSFLSARGGKGGKNGSTSFYAGGDGGSGARGGFVTSSININANGGYGSGGGGAGSPGGSCTMGGGGGGGGGGGAGGQSLRGGDGGDGATNAAASNGAVPGGGGGGAVRTTSGSALGGIGAAGIVRVWCW